MDNKEPYRVSVTQTAPVMETTGTYEAMFCTDNKGRNFIVLTRTDNTEKPEKIPVKKLAERTKGKNIVRFNLEPKPSYNPTSVANYFEQAYLQTGGTMYGYMGNNTFVVKKMSDDSKSWWSIWTIDGLYEYSEEFEEEHLLDGCSVAAATLKKCVKDFVPSNKRTAGKAMQ